MSLWFDVARVAAAVNVVLLLGLTGIWVTNYARFRSKHSLGLLVFGVLLLLENAVALYLYLLDPQLATWFAHDVPAVAWRSMMALHVLEMAGIGFLAWVTFD
jgi:hypothetical protein